MKLPRRPRRIAWLALVTVLACPTPSQAAGATADKDLAEAAGKVYMFASLPEWASAWCAVHAPGTTDTNARLVEEWNQANRIAALKERIIEKIPALRSKSETFRAKAFAELDARVKVPAQLCENFSSFLRQQGTLADKVPQEIGVLTGAPVRPNESSNSKRGNPAAAHGGGKPADFDVKVTPGELEGVFYNSVYEMVYGGYFGFNTRPIFLLKNGTLFDSGTPPERWRLNGKNLVFIEANGKSIPATQWSKGIPARAKTFAGRYTAMSGAGTLAVGGGDAVMAWNSLHFFKDGHFRGGSGSNSTSTNMNRSSSSFAAASADFDGEYSLDGYFITFHYRDGHTVRTFFAYVSSESDPSVISIGSKTYTCDKDARGHCLR